MARSRGCARDPGGRPARELRRVHRREHRVGLLRRWPQHGRHRPSTRPSSTRSTVTRSVSRTPTGGRTPCVSSASTRRRRIIRRSRWSASGPKRATHTRARLLGREVSLERDVEARDIYGRFLAYVVVDGTRYNDELLRDGYARYLVIAPNGAHARSMLAAELDAQHARRGLWGRVESARVPGAESGGGSGSGGEDLVDDVERRLRVEEREPRDGFAVPARRASRTRSVRSSSRADQAS